MAQAGNTEADVPLAGMILAAGASTRFGSPKQLAEYAGEALIVGAVRCALSQCSACVIVVTGANYADLAPILDELPVRIIRNPQWRDGMGSSISSGMAGVPDHSAGILLMLCDQPAVTGADLDRLIMAWRQVPGQIAAARYADTLGVPAIFPQPYWQQLRDLKKKEGAKQIIRNAKAVSAVDMPSAALDIDTPEDLDELTDNIAR